MGMLDLTHELGIGALELVNTFFPSPQYAYLKQFRKHADELGVKIPLIMCDGEGSMAAPDKASRLQAVKNHHKWVDIAAVLGCHEHPLQHRRTRRRCGRARSLRREFSAADRVRRRGWHQHPHREPLGSVV